MESRLRSLCSETEAEIRPLLLWLSEEAQQTARESCQRTKAQKYQLTECPSPSPLAGDTETLPTQGFLSTCQLDPPPEGRLKNQKAHNPERLSGAVIKLLSSD